MDTKTILLEVLGGKEFKKVPLSSTVYYFHLSWVTQGDLSVLIGDSNKQKGKGLIEAYVFEEDGKILFGLDGHKYTPKYIGISFDNDRKCEVTLLDITTHEELRLREVGKIQY